MFKGLSADCYFTGEMSHVRSPLPSPRTQYSSINPLRLPQHETLALTQQGKSVIVCNHTNTERPYLRHVLRDWLKKEMSEEVKEDGEGEWEVVVSEMDRDPLEVV